MKMLIDNNRRFFLNDDVHKDNLNMKKNRIVSGRKIYFSVSMEKNFKYLMHLFKQQHHFRVNIEMKLYLYYQQQVIVCRVQNADI